jgi:hypothetical protein
VSRRSEEENIARVKRFAERGFRPRAPGEIAIRTGNMPAMVGFYRDIPGLRILAQRDGGCIRNQPASAEEARP